MNNIVSIVVVTYNSSKTILDTLNSIRHQTYQLSNIELVITDDASTDKTILIVNEWLELNGREFYKVILLDNTKNEGVASNINKAWRLCTGSWVKSIAGDDLLFPNCIEVNVNFVKNNLNTKILFSNVKLFTCDIANQLKDLSHDSVFFKLSSSQQHHALLYENKLIAPSAFISRQLLIDVGYADEKYCMIEDYPLWLKISQSGERFFLLNKFTVYYRYDESLSNQISKIGNVKYLESMYNFKKDMIWPHWPKRYFLRYIDEIFNYHEKFLLIKLFSNKSTKAYKIIHRMLFLIRPYQLYTFLFSKR